MPNFLKKFQRIPNRLRLMLGVKNWKELLTAIQKNQGGKFILRNRLAIYSYDGFGSGVIREICFSSPYGVIPKNAIIIDIGAHIGTFTLQAAKAHSLNRVYAFEPLPGNFKILKRNVSANDFTKRVFIFPFAVAGKKGERQFTTRGSPHGSFFQYPDDRKYITVKTLTLTDIFKQNNLKQCHLLKLDCEGAEFEILYSTPRDILKGVQRLVMEYHIVSNSPLMRLPRLISFLKNNGFRVTKCQKNNQQNNIGILWAEQKIKF